MKNLEMTLAKDSKILYSHISLTHIGPHLSNWIWINLLINTSQEHLNKNYGIHDNPVRLEKHMYP